MKSNFWILCKYELKKLLPVKHRGRKLDLWGSAITLLITLLIAVAFIFFLNIIAESYVQVKVDKIKDPLARSAELLNLLYTGVIAALSIMCLVRMYKILCKNEETLIFLRLPVKPETIFLSKISVLTLEHYVRSLLLLVPVNIVVYLMLQPGPIYWLYSLIVWLFLPIIPLFIAAILILPCMKTVNFIVHKYPVMFVLVTLILVGAFLLYSELLAVVQTLLQTGTIKFLFNEAFVRFLQTLRKITYPANMFTDITLGIDLWIPLLAIIAFVLVSFLAVYFITKKLFYTMLYKDDQRKSGQSTAKRYRRCSPLLALLKKEFISVFRNPGHMFSYFAIATAMPVMAYCCYTLFESLILNAIGLSMNFPLALFVVLTFSVLTNTFCATNITRDGLSFLASKMFPVRPFGILLSKVIFCMIVSTLSVVVSAGILTAFTSVGILDGVAVALIGTVFSAAQIFVATKLDLNNAHLASGRAASERAADKTVAKVIFFGLLLSTGAGVCSMIAFAFSGISEGVANGVLSYLLPSAIAALYLLMAVLYYRHRMEERFVNLVA